jgi:trehalose-phosphatase
MNISGTPEDLARIQQARRLRLFLDYDGTLASFAPTPDEIYPDQELIALLGRLRDAPKIEPAIISGRRLGHIKKLVPVEGILLAGTYGIELVLPDGDQVQREEHGKIRPILEKIKPEWARLIKSRPGFYLEDKDWSLALHARDAEDRLAEEILGQARRSIPGSQSFLKDFRVLGGHKFLEVAPMLANKGLTIEWLLVEKPLDGALPVYIGDDDKDEEAFVPILEFGGVAIKVSSTEVDSKAQLRLKDPAAVRHFLSLLKA